MADFSLRKWLDGEQRLLDGERSAVLDTARLPAARPKPPQAVRRRQRHRGYLRRWRRFYAVLAVVTCLMLIVALAVTVLYLPRYGAVEDNPTLNGVVEYYLRRSAEETGAANFVAAVVFAYRAMDTFGEAVVIFAATAAVIYLLYITDRPVQLRPARAPKSPRNQILWQTVRLLFPYIAMYALYMICNGHTSPGGGFAGGAILGGGLILWDVALGEDRRETILSPERAVRAMVVCLGLYAVLKGVSFFAGANGMDWHLPTGTPGHILSGGLILPLNVCVGVITAGCVITAYVLFTRAE